MQKSFSGLFKYTKHDLLASVVVFLVALPLCLGIALASEVPLFMGLISGIIGGIVVGTASKSRLSVSGPAAGLVVIVIDAVSNLGTIEAFLLAVAIAGVIQLIMGFAKAGVIGLYFPSSVIKGMLAAIGLILIFKQIPHLVGFDADAFGEMEYFQKDGLNTFTALWESRNHVAAGSLFIGVFSMLLLMLWNLPFIKKNKVLGQIPGGILVVIIALGINALFMTSVPQLSIDSSHLVNLPIFSNWGSFTDELRFPDIGQIGNYRVYLTAVTIAIVASLETLLSIEAIDKLDPDKRSTPQNAELKAQGLGNLLCGLIGGLPITAVIVRSTTNLDAGAKTKMSAIYHGILLVMAVAIFPSVMNMIPLSALAAILIMVGYKLTKPSLYKAQYAVGRKQFIPFVVTVVAILFTDLLIGILIGMAVGIFYILKSNYSVPYHYEEEVVEGGTLDDPRKHILIRLSEHVSFLNKANLQNTLNKLPENSVVTIDGMQAKQIDHDALEVIHDFRFTAHEREIEVKFKSIPEL